MDIRDAAENALSMKILDRMERCPWDLVNAARYYRLRTGGWSFNFREKLEKYADRLPEWLED
jgi:hypothetical protein